MNLIKTNTVHCVKFVFSTSRLLGFLSFDVDVSRLDINQCDDSLTSKSTLQLQTFKDTHKCHSETSQVRNWIKHYIRGSSSKGDFSSDHSALTKRPDTKTQISLIFSGFLPAFLDFLPENYSIILE